MQHYFLEQFVEHLSPDTCVSCYATDAMTSTRTIKGNDLDKSFSKIEICPNARQKKILAATKGTSTDSIEYVYQDTNCISDFSS